MRHSSRLLLTMIAWLFMAAVPTPVMAQQAKNVVEFCGVWQGVCNRTCPSGPGKCAAECSTRASGCRTSGCFQFSKPGPRCFNSAADREMTDANRASNPDRERARRARQQQ
jgi:hypothetical protein